MNPRGKYFKSSGLLIISLIIINMAIILTAAKYYAVEKEVLIKEKARQLQNITEIKNNQIIEWRNERLSDARYLSVSPQITENFQLLVMEPNNMKYQRMLYDNLEGMYLNGHYESMLVLDKKGHIIFSIPENGSSVKPFLAYGKHNLISNSGQIQMGKMFLWKDSVALMQITIPKYKITTMDTIAFGWLLLNVNLRGDFFSLLETGTFPAESIEILLVYLEGDEIVFLNRKENQRLALSALTALKGKHVLPACKAVKGFTGTEEGIDCRGVKVLASTLQVTGSNLFLVVMIDEKEVYAEIREIRIIMIILAGLLMVALTFTISFFWLRQRGELLILEKEKGMMAKQFDMLSKFANDAIMLYTRDMTILQVNDKALELYGYTREELLGMSVVLLRSPQIRKDLPDQLDEIIRDGGQRYETMHQRKDGSVFPVEVSTRYMEILGSNCFQSIVRDIAQRKLFEKAMIESEERLRQITNTMPQIVWTAKPNGKFDFVNSRFELLTGITPFKEHALENAIHKDDFEGAMAYWMKSIHEAHEHQIRFRLRMRNGNYRWYLCLAIPLCHANGEVIRWYGSATDIDELENLVSRRTAELSDLYNNAPCGYYSLDTDGTFIKINDTALHWLGFTREEMIGKRTLADLVKPDRRDAFTKSFQLLKTKGYLNNLEFDLVRNDGTILPVLLSATAINDDKGNLVTTRITIIDYTERKRHENEILKLNTILQEHGYNLEYANKELEAFIYSVSHDLRAPLRAINGFARILLDDYRIKLDTEGQRMLDTVCENADRMKHLIDDLLRLSKTSRQELTYTKIDMHALISSMIDETKRHFPDRPISVKMNTLLQAYGDLALLKQVYSNLLSNAVKFSTKQETTEIEIGSLPGNGELTYYLKDNGTGFDMKYANQLFVAFRRLNNADDYEGTGVGLALVKRIIDKHGGRIWAESEPGKGATFYFTLPGNKSI